MKQYETRVEPSAEVAVGGLTSPGGGAVVGRIEVTVPREDLSIGVRRAMAWTAAADRTGCQIVNVIDVTPTRFDVRVALLRERTQ